MCHQYVIKIRYFFEAKI